MPMLATTFAVLIDSGVLEIGDGYRAKLEELGGTGPIFLRAVHVTDQGIDFDGVERFREELAPRLLGKMSRPKDTVVTTKGNSTGRTTFVNPGLPSFVYSPHLSYWRSKDNTRLVPEYLRFWALSREFHEQLDAMKGSTDMAPYLSLVDQRSLKITLPEPAEQRAASSVLSSLEDKIELNRRMNRVLDSLAGGLFRSWFVDFDPVIAKAAGRKPYGMDDATARLFPDAFEDSELGPIPKRWHTSSVYAVADVTYGAPFASRRFNSEGIGLPLIRIRDLVEQTPSVYTDERHPKGTVIHAGDILVGMDGNFPVCIWSGPDAWLNQRVCTFVPKPQVSRAFVYQAIRDPMAEFENEKVGTTVNHLGKGDIDRIKLVLPPETLMQAFKKTADPFLARVIQNNREAVRLAAIRDDLLPELLSGEIRLTDAERRVAKAV